MTHLVLSIIYLVFLVSQPCSAVCHESCGTCVGDIYDINGCLQCAPGFYPAYDPQNRVTLDTRPGPCKSCPSVSYCSDGSISCDYDGMPCVNPYECSTLGSSAIVTAQAAVPLSFTDSSYHFDFVFEKDCDSYYPTPVNCAPFPPFTAIKCLDSLVPNNGCKTVFGQQFWDIHPEVGLPLGITNVRSVDDIPTHLLLFRPFDLKNALILRYVYNYDHYAATLNTPTAYSRLYVYCMTGNGNATMSVRMTYEDGSTSWQTNLTCPDWSIPASAASQGAFNLTGRVPFYYNIIHQIYTNGTLFENLVTNVTSTKKLVNIMFTDEGCIGTDCISTVWAVSGIVVQPPHCSVNATASIGSRTRISSSSIGSVSPLHSSSGIAQGVGEGSGLHTSMATTVISPLRLLLIVFVVVNACLN